MKLFTVRLTDEERAKLEAFRAARGLRSESDAVRALIAESSRRDVAPERVEAVAWVSEAKSADGRYRRNVEVFTANPETGKPWKEGDTVGGVQIGPVPSVPGSRLKRK